MYWPTWSVHTLSGSVRRFRAEGSRREVSSRSGDLRVAPGGRYRADFADEQGDRTLEVCDGQSVWFAEDGRARFSVPAEGSVPFTDLLNPAWLLADYALVMAGSREHADRDGIALVGHERDALGLRDSTASANRIDAVIDAQLGILLFDSKTGRRPESAEFTRLTVRDGDSADPAEFRLPETGTPADPSPTAQPAAAAQTPTRPAAASSSGSISSGLIEQLYHAALRPRRFSATLHERADTGALAAVLRETSRARRGVLAFVADLAADNLRPVDLRAELDLALPGKYRIELISGSIPAQPR